MSSKRDQLLSLLLQSYEAFTTLATQILSKLDSIADALERDLCRCFLSATDVSHRTEIDRRWVGRLAEMYELKSNPKLYDPKTKKYSLAAVEILRAVRNSMQQP